MSCAHAASGCNYPEGHCAGLCQVARTGRVWVIQVKAGDRPVRYLSAISNNGNAFNTTSRSDQAIRFVGHLADERAHQLAKYFTLDPLWTGIKFEVQEIVRAGGAP